MLGGKFCQGLHIFCCLFEYFAPFPPDLSHNLQTSGQNATGIIRWFTKRSQTTQENGSQRRRWLWVASTHEYKCFPTFPVFSLLNYKGLVLYERTGIHFVGSCHHISWSFYCWVNYLENFCTCGWWFCHVVPLLLANFQMGVFSFAQDSVWHSKAMFIFIQFSAGDTHKIISCFTWYLCSSKTKNLAKTVKVDTVLTLIRTVTTKTGVSCPVLPAIRTSLVTDRRGVGPTLTDPSPRKPRNRSTNPRITTQTSVPSPVSSPNKPLSIARIAV